MVQSASGETGSPPIINFFDVKFSGRGPVDREERVDFLAFGVDPDPETALRDRANATLSWMQPGLIYPAPHQCSLSVPTLPEKVDRAAIAGLVSDTRRKIHNEFGSVRASLCVGFSFKTWARFCQADGMPLPTGLQFSERGTDEDVPGVLGRATALQASGAQAWFLIKADEADAVSALADYVASQLKSLGVSQEPWRVVMRSRTNPTLPKGGMGGRILGGRFQENLRNPTAPVEILEHVLVGDEDPASMGGAFVFTQRFNLNWPELHSKNPTEVESLVGRHVTTDGLIQTFDKRSHVQASHAHDATGNTIKLLRIGLPFGSRQLRDDATPLIEKAGSSSPADEAGIYFIGIARSAARIETVLQSQFGGPGSRFATDRMLSGSIARSDLGGFFYIPSVRELGASALVEDLTARTAADFSSWARFPAVDWNRLNRHYDQRSKNGRMFYNHQDYLFCVGTLQGPAEQPPLSLRIQFLLERLFSKWDDTWYRSQKPAEVRPLRSQLIDFLGLARNVDARRDLCVAAGIDPAGKDASVKAAAWVMDQSAVTRAAWAVRLLCNLASRLDGIGQRGNGGMDTCDIHPLDLLAGSMPAQSLAEGRYLIDYTRDDDNEAEKFKWYNLSLGPNSGVGHVVPGYEELLRLGIAGMRDRIDEAAAGHEQAAGAEAAKATTAFYDGGRLALAGLSEYLAGLADTVADKAATFAAGAFEHASLGALEARLRWLAKGERPRGVLEALQLLLASHACLHLCGEPVAIGRLDRMLRPFVEAEGIADDALQEAVDAFWLKIGEKVLLNRIFLDDRQEQGNLAMGSRAGPYPKGQSVNQWIQQLTIGGKNPDGSWEYSQATLACLRAAGRLPFNAPVLSLRVSADMPAAWREKLLTEAAKTQLSGGASPILLNDDKIIPGMARSGDGLGPAHGDDWADLWNSKVREEDAYNYACDGCYEPQFVGANWFHLGGMTLLQPLEYALNQGRSIQSAGAVDLLGKNMSFRSKPASAIADYDELEAIFLKHFEWLFARQMDGTVGDFGRMQDVCPSPLLNLFINDCLTKGQDIYAGGARYNVFGPCFTSLANTINSLWAIRSMCFGTDTAVTTLGELVSALLCNWGENIIDPLVHPQVQSSDAAKIEEATRRFRQLREIALSLPRWGRGEKDIDAFGNRVCEQIATICAEVMTKPRKGLRDQYEKAARRFGTKAHPFGGFCIQPGVGTFASYVENGLGCAASADGRLSGHAIGTDMSPAPSPIDRPALPATRQLADAVEVLENLRSPSAFGFANGAPLDFNIEEGMDVKRLIQILSAFVDGAGSNILTVTTADQGTFLAAPDAPEAHDLLRVRMGGWTEMFVALHALHQRVHPRRPYST